MNIQKEKRNIMDMGRKHGPCFHCGISYTLRWRPGPEDKPVLCNACGTRYIKWGSLEDYLPTHFEPKHLENFKKPRGATRKNLLISCYLTDGESQHLWSPKIPTKKRSHVVHKKLTPMQRFHRQLLMMWKMYGNPNESSA